MHLADVPRHIGGRKCDLEPSGDAMPVHLIDVVYPDRHPDALIALFVSIALKGGSVRATAAASLRARTEKMQVSMLDPAGPKLGGVPQSHNFFCPHVSHHANVPVRSDTFKIGVNACTSTVETESTGECTAGSSSSASFKAGRSEARTDACAPWFGLWGTCVL